MSLWKVIGCWMCFAIGVTAVVAVSMLWLDVPIARIFAPNVSRFAPIGQGLGSAVLVSGEMLVMAVLIAVRLASGHLPPLGKSVLVALVASLTTFTANDAALKVFFGIPNPTLFIYAGAGHNFHFWHGGPESSFPSGHMALAASFAFAIARIYWRTLMVFSVALLFSGAVLIFGDWHFLSDVIAGTFVGGTFGLVAGELWMQHSRRLGS
jgi:membrane-associated phospholipid phosphatase